MWHGWDLMAYRKRDKSQQSGWTGIQVPGSMGGKGGSIWNMFAAMFTPVGQLALQHNSTIITPPHPPPPPPPCGSIRVQHTSTHPTLLLIGYLPSPLL